MKKGVLRIWRGQDLVQAIEFDDDDNITGMAFDYVATRVPSIEPYADLPLPEIVGTVEVTGATTANLILAHDDTKDVVPGKYYHQIRRTDDGSFNVVHYGETLVQGIAGPW